MDIYKIMTLSSVCRPTDRLQKSSSVTFYYRDKPSSKLLTIFASLKTTVIPAGVGPAATAS